MSFLDIHRFDVRTSMSTIIPPLLPLEKATRKQLGRHGLPVTMLSLQLRARVDRGKANLKGWKYGVVETMPS